MSVIYEPKGMALEYAELAANLYRGCSHACRFCYALPCCARVAPLSRASATMCSPSRPDMMADSRRTLNCLDGCAVHQHVSTRACRPDTAGADA